MRHDIAYILMVALLGVLCAVIAQTRRYSRYQARLLRGARPHRPVRRPFWMP